MATTGDLERQNAELQKQVGQLQAELGDAKKSLEYMNQLLAALKAHKKATAAAKVALENLREQIKERDQEISDLTIEKSRLQEMGKNLQSEVDEAEMSTMHSIAAAADARKQHILALKQLEKQHESEKDQVVVAQEQAIEQWRLKLDDANTRDTQKLVTIMVMGAIDNVKSGEATELRASIALLQAETASLSSGCMRKDQEIQQLEASITDRDSRIEELKGCLSNDDTEKHRLKGVIQDLERGREELQTDLTAAKVSCSELEQAQEEMMERHRAELESKEQEKAMLHSRSVAQALQLHWQLIMQAIKKCFACSFLHGH